MLASRFFQHRRQQYNRIFAMRHAYSMTPDDAYSTTPKEASSNEAYNTTSNEAYTGSL